MRFLLVIVRYLSFGISTSGFLVGNFWPGISYPGFYIRDFLFGVSYSEKGTLYANLRFFATPQVYCFLVELGPALFLLVFLTVGRLCCNCACQMVLKYGMLF